MVHNRDPSDQLNMPGTSYPRTSRPHTCLSNFPARHRARMTACICPKAAQQQQHTAEELLQQACSILKAKIGFNSQGFRGLIATGDLQPGDVVISVPLHNTLQVPKTLTSLVAVAAARSAVSEWQEHHGALPEALTGLITDPSCCWEAKLVCWLLHLAATAPHSSLWHSYCQLLPAAEETITFTSYSPEQAEQLQFKTWRTLAASQWQLSLEVQEQYNKYQQSRDSCHQSDRHTCQSNNSNSTIGGKGSSANNSSLKQTDHQATGNIAQSDRADVGWALSMVKSRTFGGPLSKAPASSASAIPCNERSISSELPAYVQELEPADDGSEPDVILFMVPFADMVNHSFDNNCKFGVDWAANNFTIVCSDSIPQGSEVTISYGSNKNNLALLSSYGFQCPSNANDAHLLEPIFSSCLAAASGLAGFDRGLLKYAATGAALQESSSSSSKGHKHQFEQQQQQPPLTQGRQQGSRDNVHWARRQCAVSALPVAPATVEDVANTSIDAATANDAAALQDDNAQGYPSASGPSSSKQQLQLQKYLAELIVYQVQQMLRLCATTAREDVAILKQMGPGGVLDVMPSVGSGAAMASKRIASEPEKPNSQRSSTLQDTLTFTTSTQLAIMHQAVSARLEHKLLLAECADVCQQLICLIDTQVSSTS